MIDSLGISANQWKFLRDPEKYVNASQGTGRPLVFESTYRQFITAEEILVRLAGSYGQERRKGILLADDVGLGKTTVAALVAWVFAGTGKRVRILAPNQVMKRRWAEELTLHVDLLTKCATHLKVDANQIKGRFYVERLKVDQIQIGTHSLATNGKKMVTDLLIVDEAHRAKGENTQFSKGLKRIQKDARRVLILTATPFSIQINELTRMLNLIGGKAANPSVKGFSKAIDDLYRGDTSRDPAEVAKRLSEKAEDAVNKISQFVIRHGVDDLPKEEPAFGKINNEWKLEIPAATSLELELMIRMDRALRITRKNGSKKSKITNDARFHVGWQYFDATTSELSSQSTSHESSFGVAGATAIKTHLNSIQELRSVKAPHSKIKAVGDVVKLIVEQGEKVVLFCHHHATAQELAIHLKNVIAQHSHTGVLGDSKWKNAWFEAWGSMADEGELAKQLQKPFIDWLCCTTIRAQVQAWANTPMGTQSEVLTALKQIKARGQQNSEVESVDTAAKQLFRKLLDSNSSKTILRRSLAGNRPLPGSKYRVLALCPPPNASSDDLLFENQQPDTAISVFNSPFGPDVLVVTDKLSEGIDLHRYCRHLIHYELNPSPIRTIQRNGRLRRVNSWASVTKEPIKVAYPAFRGTRDFKLVQIMKQRISSFSLLLGGVQEIDVDSIENEQEQWRNEVILKAKSSLAKLGGKLIAKNY